MQEKFSQDTQRLKELIAQVDSSGLAAWDAGEILERVKSSKSYFNAFSSFEEYTRLSFNINKQTANTYISIFETFDRAEIGKLTLVTHLKVILEIENDKLKKSVLKGLRELNDENRSALSYSTKEVVAIVSILQQQSSYENTEDLAKEVIQMVVEKSGKEERRKQDAKRKQKATYTKDFFGERFNFSHFKEVGSLFENEPINEMGVVALFCLMFSSIREIPFFWKGEKISFISIKFVRAGFPDACIRCRQHSRKNPAFELDVEFQFMSYDYIRDGHLKSSKNCDLIVCWEDNAKSDLSHARPGLRQKLQVKDLPPVLALKNCLETGEINLVD